MDLAARDVGAELRCPLPFGRRQRSGAPVPVGQDGAAGLPVVGAEQADKLLAPRAVPANTLLGPDWPGPG
jgi:hypothetical protein